MNILWNLIIFYHIYYNLNNHPSKFLVLQLPFVYTEICNTAHTYGLCKGVSLCTCVCIVFIFGSECFVFSGTIVEKH